MLAVLVPARRTAMKKIMTSRLLYLVLFVFLVMTMASCATVGRSFPEHLVQGIKIGTTTKEEVAQRFGQPWRTGWEDGLETWTYGRYKYRAFQPTESSDLVIRFDKGGIVNSYAYSTTKPQVDGK